MNHGFLATPRMADIKRLQSQIDQLKAELDEHRHGYRWEKTTWSQPPAEDDDE